MELFYGGFVLLFLVGGAAAIYLKLKISDARAVAAEQAALQARQAAATAERELRAYIAILSEPERQRIEREQNRSRPMPTPPSGLWPTLTRLRQLPEHTGDPYAFALGWEITRGNPDVVSLTFANDSEYRAGHIAVTGESGHGKGTLVHNILLQLAHTATTSQMRIQIIDRKRSDGALWAGKAHLWRAPVLGDAAQPIRDIMAALRQERQRRDDLREQYRVREWEELPIEVRPPLLVVWITELAAVVKALDNADDWLEEELGACRSSGVRYILDLQNQSGKEMSWRTHVGTFIGGFQSSTYHIRPNLGLGAEEITELGGVLPTELHRGQFTVRNKRDVVSITIPPLSTADIATALQPLPDAASTLPAEGVAGNEPTSPRSPSAEELQISPELWARIATVARDLERTQPRPNRADVYRTVFANGDPTAKARGENYMKVKVVCDTEGLMMPRTPPAPAVAPVPEMVDTA